MSDSLFEAFTNISKAHAYDILVEQVKELKEQRDRLLVALRDLEAEASNYADVIQLHEPRLYVHFNNAIAESQAAIAAATKVK